MHLIATLAIVFLLLIWQNDSSDLNHITGTYRPMQLFINKRYLQILPHGKIQGTTNSNSMYTILRRRHVAKIKNYITIQNAFTCMYLCIDNCGRYYGAVKLSKDCFFRERIEKNHYNTYSKVYNKTKTYIALSNIGLPKKIKMPQTYPIGKIFKYVMAIPVNLKLKFYKQCLNIKPHLGYRKCR
ncbi:Fibroblast growth factor [Lonomia obliqua multiple nucleopolyhedrovirus]|uniref:Fibroblast growth factor n=1 Tax=Lonomia obliqua multiple nucleopolyhedrovirus TaxID=134394 RepID=A0A126FC93_9ABAC|nr:Fibroblast growth factor [Lonomia obliqua multiple nucleopolyhedrovirus]AKN81003.1 Fibroblast growth factor [Lonomia obliqua multiple nucleopolyhedrovirus]